MSIKLDEQDLKTVRDLRGSYQQIMLQLGQAELQKSDLEFALDGVENQKAQLLKKYGEIKTQEREKLDALNKKYGVGSLNIETGEFTPVPQENQPQNLQQKPEPSLKEVVPTLPTDEKKS